MIELRNLIFGVNPFVCQLQYRESEGVKINDRGEEVTKWGKWKDVPCVPKQYAEDES